MKRCINCLAPCGDDVTQCPECGFDGTSKIKHEHSLPAGTRLAGRYVLGGVQSARKPFLTYYAFDTQTRERVRISEYMPSKLMYRLPDEVVVKYHSVEASARGEREIRNICAHFSRLCEISAVSALDFTNCFTENSTAYYVCSVASGTALSSLIGNGRKLPFAQAMNLLAPVFDTAEKLERSGKWHGCISPYSIITDNNQVVSVSGYTYPPSSFSSPFDAPEKKLGLKECGTHTDIYALGAILYEAVTGFLPPSAAQRELGRPLRFPASMPDNEKAILEKALAFNKDVRYRHIGEFTADIAALSPQNRRPAAPVKEKNRQSSAPEKGKKKTPAKEIVRRIVFVVALISLILSLGYLLNYFIIEPYRASKKTENLDKEIITTVANVDPWEAIMKEYPDVAFPEGMNPEYANLYAKNPDMAGRVSIPGTDLAHYVVQREGDNEYYLRRDFEGNSTNYGNPFFDYRNNIRDLNRNTVIYGHNMRSDDEIFGVLEEYKDPEFFKTAPIIKLDTIYGKYTFKIYAVFISNSKESDDNGHVFNYIFTQAGDSQFENYIREVDKRKLYTTGVDINETDKIITLSTCCYDFEDARLVVVGRLLRDGETEQINTAAVAVNPSPKFPQAYYDVKKQTNPYKNDPDLFG